MRRDAALGTADADGAAVDQAPRDARARLLWVDGVAGAVAGGVVLVFSGWFARLHQLPHDVVLFVGFANLLYGAYSLSLARRPDRTLRQVEVLAIANAAWVPVCLALVVRYWDGASVFGIAHLLGEALFVGVLAALEWRRRHALVGA